jgi:putative NADPH-quinone reductase
MRILLVFCHPAPDSFQHTILERLVARLERDGHDLRTFDLYAKGFDPVLDLEAWRAHRENQTHPAADVVEHVTVLREAGGLILVYPTWWYGLPAMLKGWFDRVWQPGVAFAIEDGVFRTRYLGNVTRFAAITTYGSPRWFIERIVGDPARRQLVRGLARQFARGAKSCWRPIYDVDNRSRGDLDRASERAVAAVARHFARPSPH